MSRLQTIATLNNNGVTLLSKGAYKQAINAFRLASSIYKGENTESFDTIETQAQSMLSELVATLSSSITVKSLKYQQEDLSAYLSVMQYGPSMSVIYPIRLPATADDEDTVDDLAILLLLQPLQKASQYRRTSYLVTCQPSLATRSNLILDHGYGAGEIRIPSCKSFLADFGMRRCHFEHTVTNSNGRRMPIRIGRSLYRRH
jgi:hypothetical protein